jgi:4-amino-4-deoxy-L-arabinose transferase-like glycosyltransferase
VGGDRELISEPGEGTNGLRTRKRERAKTRREEAESPLVRWLRRSAVGQATALAAVAFLLRALHLRFIAASPLFQAPAADEYENWSLALNLAADNWLGEGLGPYFRPQLFAYLLALLHRLTGGSLALIHVVLALLDAVTIGVMYLVARAAWPRRTALLGAGVLVLYWPLLYFGTSLNKDSFGIHLQAWMLLAVVVWMRGLQRRRPSLRPLLAAGICAGLGLLCRPPLVLPLLGLLAAMALVARRRGLGLGRALLAPGIVGTVAVLLLVPPALRNFTIGGAPIVYSTNGWLNLYFTNNGDGVSWLEYSPGVGWQLLIERPQLEGGVADGDYAGIDAFWRRRFLAYVRHQPAAFLKGVAAKLVAILNAKEVAITNNFREMARLSPVQRWLPGTGIWFPLALVGIVTWLRRRPARAARRDAGTLLLTFGALYLLAAALVFPVTRDRLPAMAVLLLFAGPGAQALYAASRRRAGSASLVPVATLAAALALVHWPLPDGGLTRQEECLTELNRGASLLQLWDHDHQPQQLSEAITAFERALQIRPEALQPLEELPRAYWFAGRRDEAMAVQERLVARLRQEYPRNVRARSQQLEAAGRLALMAEQPARAEAAAREWRALGVRPLAAMDLQAVALARRGEMAAAMALAQERARQAPGDPEAARLLQTLRDMRPPPPVTSPKARQESEPRP